MNNKGIAASIGAILILIGLADSIFSVSISGFVSKTISISFIDTVPKTTILLAIMALATIGSSIGLVASEYLEGIIASTIAIALINIGWAYYRAKQVIPELESEYSVKLSLKPGAGLIILSLGLIIIIIAIFMSKE